jgi:hypothetical protein
MTEKISFFEKVHEVASQIPFGRVTSYGAIAGFLGSKGSARMVGWAMNKSIIIKYIFNQKKESKMKEFITFEKMIAPIIIMIVFWIAVLVDVIFAFITMFTVSIWAGLAILIFGPLLLRVYFELMIVIFKIFGTLKEIRDK